MADIVEEMRPTDPQNEFQRRVYRAWQESVSRLQIVTEEFEDTAAGTVTVLLNW